MRTTLSLSLAALILGASARTAEEQNALSDPTAECAWYDYPPVTNVLASYPPIGTPVKGIMPGDSAGQAKFDSFKANIPNIAPRGVDGAFATDALSKYDKTDPDCWWSFSTCAQPKLAGLKPDIFDVPEPRTLGYGFDDGPNCSHNAFYDLLQQNKQKATMFFIGTNVVAEPLQALRAAQDGHEICVHTWSHRAMTAFTNEQIFGELWYTMQIIKVVTGYTPTCWRPPQGDADDRVRFIAQQLGLQNIIWKHDTFDWHVPAGQSTPEEVQKNYDDFIALVGKGEFDHVGAILLAHELDNYTMQTAMDNYAKLVKAFDHVVPVGVAFNKTQPYVETNLTFPNFQQYISGQSGGSSGTPSGSGKPSGSGSPSKSGSAASPSNTTGQQGGISAGVSVKAPAAMVLGLLGAALVL
ncbi:carbohydrate esterase family 4 protein [Favolaschia claudopus]|uniref:chitin deacetylase n=1 Tax=Favolaschia claudopus TaxID=2862362 RepID=A0AAW0D144_9AGAR